MEVGKDCLPSCCGGSPALTARNTQAAKDAAAREAALAGDAITVQLKAQVARAGQALKECEHRQVCLRSAQPAMPGQALVVAGMAQHEVALGCCCIFPGEHTILCLKRANTL